MTAKELRQKFLKFFEERGHAVIPSASLIPENDPSVLFTTAGMHPLVPYLLGGSHPAGRRLVDAQKCLRTGDIDEVGDATHLTFFEMLGNWSLGDYFKDDSIKWSYEFLTDKKWLGIDPKFLAVSVFAGDETAARDEESVKIWKSLGITEKRIAYLDKEENWWPAGGKHPGPQGPDTEIFYWVGTEEVPERFDPKDKQWVEIWNNVFMQFNRTPDGMFEPLRQKNIDTGMGLERTVAVLQGAATVFETDLFVPIIKKIEEFSGKKYGEADEVTRAMRIIADHLRAVTFVLGDDFGVVPSNKDQGYILRRLIRRAIVQGDKLGMAGFFTDQVARVVIDEYGEAYPELQKNRDQILIELDKEEQKFGETLKMGLKKLRKMETVDTKEAFDLFQSYGFPVELIREELASRGLYFDDRAFKEEFEKHQALSRAGSEEKFKGGLVDDSPAVTAGHTATHLMLQALRAVLGDHVTQRGSNITAERIRFDFSHPEKLTDEQKKMVEEIVNEQIKKDLSVKFEMMDVTEAKAAGAIGVFDDKYAQMESKLKVYFIGDDQRGYFSKEICGGPHVGHTDEIGSFKIIKEEASSAGVRRIKAKVGV